MARINIKDSWITTNATYEAHHYADDSVMGIPRKALERLRTHFMSTYEMLLDMQEREGPLNYFRALEDFKEEEIEFLRYHSLISMDDENFLHVHEALPFFIDQYLADFISKYPEYGNTKFPAEVKPFGSGGKIYTFKEPIYLHSGDTIHFSFDGSSQEE